jgi:hypothetical protein
MVWQCEQTYVLPEQIQSCRRVANNFPWYLLAAGFGLAVGLFSGEYVHEKREEKNQAS